MVRRVIRRSAQVAGQREAKALAAALGGTVRASRRARHLTLEALAARIGLSRARLAEIERGDGGGTPLATWIALGIALERPLAVAFSRALDQPRGTSDAGHLEI